MNNITDNKEKAKENSDISNNRYKIIEQNFLELTKEENEKEINKNLDEINKNLDEINKEKIKIKENYEIQNETQINIKEKETNKKQKSEFTKKIGNYILFDQIGMGTFSKVTKAIHLITSQQVAVKILDKEKIEDEIDLERIIREIEILKNIHHPNIAQMYETYSTIHNFYLMMELVTGGDLFDYITLNSYLSENLSCRFFRQLIGVLEYLISMGIAHRDIKPENILLDGNHKNIKVIDFGLSNYFENDELLCSSCGSPCYASPEMLSGKPYQGLKTDIWSGGIVLYSMLVGSLPFDDQELYKLYEQIKKGKFFLPSTLSLEAIDLLKRILQVDPDKRIGIEEIKKHPWFNMEKNPIYKGINISKEKFPCNKEVVRFILDNYFKNEKDINFDLIVNMVETHACNKYTSTYYLTKMNILGIDDECSNSNNGDTDNKKNNNNKDLKNNLLENEKSENINNYNYSSKTKEKQFHKCRSKDYMSNNFNKIKLNILGLLNDIDYENENGNENEELHKINLNINTNAKTKTNTNNITNKNEPMNTIIITNREKEKEKEKQNDNIYIKNDNNSNSNSNYINNNQIKKSKKKEMNNLKLKNEVYHNKKAIKISFNNYKRDKILNQKNNKNILYINKNRNKLKTFNELKETNYINSVNNTYRLKPNTLYDKNNFIMKTNNNSYNKSIINDKINKKLKEKKLSLNNKSKNNNLSEGYKTKQITYIKKKNNTPNAINAINEIRKYLIQLKTPPRKNSNYNFYILNNINKEKKYVHKKFSTLNYDNKTVVTEPGEIKSFINKKLYNFNKNDEINKYNNHKILNKNINKIKIIESNKYNQKSKNDQTFAQFSLKTQLNLGKKLIKKGEINKLNKIRVNLKSNNNNNLQYKNKSPAKTIEINLHKKSLKIPKLKLENINNKIKEPNRKKSSKENSIPNNKLFLNDNNSFYAQSINKEHSINNKSDNLSKYNEIRNSNNTKRKINKNNCLISKNYLTQIKPNVSLTEDFKKLYNQRNLSSADKSKSNNNKLKNNLAMNSNKIYYIIKENNIQNRKNKVLKRNQIININNSYMNEYYSQNLKKRKNLSNLEYNNINSYIHKSININNNVDKKNNKKIVKKTSYLCTNIKYKINNHEINLNNNRTNNNSKINKHIKKEYFINNNNQNVININMVLNQNKYKNRNFNNHLISTDSMNDTPITLNTEQEYEQSPYFTENFSELNNSDDKNKFNIQYRISKKK